MAEEEIYSVRVDERCRHDRPPRRATVSRVPFGNEVQWQIRVYYDCDEGCHISEIRDRKPARVLDGEGEELPMGDG